MIEINISEIQKDSQKYLEDLMKKNPNEVRLEMIKFLKESFWPNCSEYGLILEFINDFFVYREKTPYEISEEDT